MQKRMIQNSKFKIKKLRVLFARDGQSLAEVMIGLAIGAILIGAASFAITTMLKTNLTAQRSQFAANLAQETIERVRSYASADWQNVYGLSKGSSTPYYFVASGTQFLVVQGSEGIIENDIRSGLVGHWGFDEATGTIAYDGTGNKKHGVLTNNPIRATSTCRVSSCLQFDGLTNYVSIPAPAITTAFTFSSWVYYVASEGGYAGLINSITGINGQRNRILLNNSNQMYYQSLVGGVTSDFYFTIPSTYKNSWHHYVLIYNGSNLTAFYDGLQTDVPKSLVGTLDGGTTNATLGWGSQTIYHLNGYMDDVRIYNRALSANEVKQLYNSSIYSRSFYVEDACRTNDASSTYSGVSPCGFGSVDDPSSQKITAQVDWGTGLGVGQIVLSDMLTRWKNAIFQQSDWSGGTSGDVLINSGTTFASSTNVDFTDGSLRVDGL